MSNNITPRTFEECYSEIEVIVEKKRYDWTMKADLMMDFDDVKNIILAHIWKKWGLYDQKRPLGGWVATIVKHQFSNILRDIYSSTSSPCTRCPCNMGDTGATNAAGERIGGCSLYGVQGPDCALYKVWYKTKRHSHDVRLPVPMEKHLHEIHTKPHVSFDLENSITGLHKQMKKVLTKSEWEIYHRLYVENKDEEQTAKELGFKTSESGRKMGYKRIRQVKTVIFAKAKKIMLEEGVESLNV